MSFMVLVVPVGSAVPLALYIFIVITQMHGGAAA